MRLPPLVLAIVAAVLVAPGVSSAQGSAAARSTSASTVWKDVNERAMTESLSPARKATAKREIVPLAYRTVQLDRAAFGTLLAAAPREFTAPLATGGLEILLPLPYGGFGRFLVQESPIMEQALADKHPEIKTYVAQGIDDPTATARLDLTPRGFHAIVLSAQGQFYIDPYWTDDDSIHIAYFKRNFVAAGKEMGCGVKGKPFDPSEVRDRIPPRPNATGSTLRIFRLALSATAEYTAAVSGTTPGTVSQALSAMVTSVNRVSAVYERDVAVRMILVAGTERLIFTDSATDGFTNNDGVTLLGENQLKADSIIGPANYDIGHVFSTGGGGIAGLGVVCIEGAKAQGVTGLNNPTGDPYDIDFVAHEMGHQFGGNHTFNGTGGSCNGNANPGTAYEVGSGVSVMAYAGICGNANNIAAHSDDFFHGASYDEINAFVASLACFTSTATGNTPPTVGALTPYTIPSQTPFALTATASDVDGDTLTYAWEEFDLGPQRNGTVLPRDNGSSPIFRPFDPSPSPTRLYPSLTYILNNANVPPASLGGGIVSGEFLPTTSRTMNFRVTVRDNRPGGGGVNFGTTSVTSVSTAGPFRISNLNTATTLAGGSSQTITWDVANSNVAPISCANVRITLSADGGRTFPIVLAASTPNTGSANVTIPNVAQAATTQGRIKVEAVGNIFFDLNDADLTVTSTNTAPTLNVLPAGITLARGTPTLTVANVGSASSPTGATPLTVAVSDLPGDVVVSPSIDASGNITLSARANCSIVTTLTSRTYPISLTVTDSLGSTRAAAVNLIITPNPSPTIGAYTDASAPNNGQPVTVSPAVAPSDANGNLSAVTVTPTSLPGGGTIAVNPSTGVVTITANSASTLGATTVRVAVLDSCGASTVRLFTVNVFSPTPAPRSGAIVGPTAEGCAPANGAVDPGETVTLDLPISNLGVAAFGNLVATLQSSGGVTPVGTASQSYGALAGGASTSRSFQLLASGTCGGTATATLQLQDGATSYGTVTYVIRLGALQTVVASSENFDGVTPPALPSGWTSTIVNGPVANWATSTVSPDTAPNAVFASPVASDSEVRLDSPAFTLPASGTNQVSFRHRWNTETSYDGGVLEISVNGGAYTDIIAAGGSFAAGGYTITISPQSSSPLGGRAAWSGSSDAAYTTTLVNLPASMLGQSVSLRFRLASDESETVAGAVWRIDTVRILNLFYTCSSCTAAPQFTSAPPPSPAVVGTPYSFQFTATGSPAPTFSVTGGTLPPGLALSSSGLLSGTPTSAGTGSFPNITVTASNGVGPAATQSFSLTVVTQAANYLASFGVSGLRSDPDGDGIANLLEYALRLDPTRASTAGLPVVQVKTYADDGQLHQFFTFTRSSLATDLAYLVETSPDLLTWTTIATSSAGAVTSGPGFVSETGTAPNFTVEVRDPQPLGTAPGSHKFMRLRVTTPP